MLSSSTATSSRNTTENEASDSENSDKGQSLLHQALKRKRTDSENDTLNQSSRRFFIATTSSSYPFNNATAQPQNFNKPSLLTSALTSPPKRPIFHLISSSTNRGSSHHELISALLKPSASLSQISKKQEVKSEEMAEVKIKIEKVD